MKKDFEEYLGFEDEKPKVGRPKLADKKTKKKSLIIACISFFAVLLLLIFGYGTLFGFQNFNLIGSVTQNEEQIDVKVDEIKPLIKDITLKVGTARKVYLTILPAKATNKEILYTSSDKNVVLVDSSGKVSAISEGNATITAITNDGTNKTATFDVRVIKDATGKCNFTSLDKQNSSIDYTVDCYNAQIKEVQYKVGDGNYQKLLSKKDYGTVDLSKEQLNKSIVFKVVYYPNNSKVTKYATRTLNNNTTTTKEPSGNCFLTFDDLKSNSMKYDITCNNAEVTKIAYKIGNGSYVGIDSSILADTILFEESDVTRIIYFNVDYKIFDSDRTKTITKSNIITSATRKVDTNE